MKLKLNEINHPQYYGGEDNPYEAIKVIEAWDLGFNLGNTIKYIARAGKKGERKTDLQKALWYLSREIEKLIPYSSLNCWKDLTEKDFPFVAGKAVWCRDHEEETGVPRIIVDADFSEEKPFRAAHPILDPYGHEKYKHASLYNDKGEEAEVEKI